MEKQKTNSLNSEKTHWLDIVENLAIVGSVSGSIACILTEKFVYATVPVSASLMLNLLNRRRLINSIKSQTRDTIASFVKEYQQDGNGLEKIYTLIEQERNNNSSQFKLLTEEIKQIQVFSENQLGQQKEENNQQITQISAEIKEVKESISQLGQLNQDLDKSFSNLNQQQSEIDKAVKELRVFGSQTQNLAIDYNSPHFYHQRGLVYQTQGNHTKAIEDYSKAIELDSEYVEAYHHRGLVNIELEEKRKAIEDLNKASQLYFQKQDLDSYRHLRSLIQQLHHEDKVNISHKEVIASNINNNQNYQEVIAVDELFS